LRVKQINPEVEGIIILSNIKNYLLNDTASHPRRMDFYFTGQEGNMHSALSHSLYFIRSSRNTYVTANGEMSYLYSFLKVYKTYARKVAPFHSPLLWKVTYHVQQFVFNKTFLC
jgi:hypothetical protein